MMLIAQSMSGEWSSPGSWSKFFETVGIPAGLLVLILVILTVLGYSVMRWTVGKHGWVRGAVLEVSDSWKKAGAKVEECMPKIETALTTNAADKLKQLDYCAKVHSPGGSSNVNDLRAAGHSAAEVLGEIGKKVDADVERHVDAIHRILDGNETQ